MKKGKREEGAAKGKISSIARDDSFFSPWKEKRWLTLLRKRKTENGLSQDGSIKGWRARRRNENSFVFSI